MNKNPQVASICTQPGSEPGGFHRRPTWHAVRAVRLQLGALSPLADLACRVLCVLCVLQMGALSPLTDLAYRKEREARREEDRALSLIRHLRVPRIYDRNN
jgi:hypothetical protein